MSLPRCHTAVLEKNETYTSSFETEPYETGWAREALWFVRVLDRRGSDVRLRVHAQISPDGLIWCDKGDPPLEISGEGLGPLPLRDFGNWLRLRVELEGEDPSVKVLVYLVLKQ